jgi:uncharacterized protein YqgC (DUF456 family)
MSGQTFEVVAALSLFLQCTFVFVNLLGLPGNMVAVIFPLLWWLGGFITPNEFFSILLVIASAEAVEFAASYFVGKKYGVSNASFVASIIGSIIGGIFGAGFLLGIGAVLGTFAGAFLGTYIYEYTKYTDHRTAMQRGLATFFGRFIGTGMKMVMGFIAVYQTWSALAH